MFYNIPSIAYNIFELIENKNKDRNILYDIFDAKFFTKDTKDTFNRWKEVLKEFNKFYDFEDNKLGFVYAPNEDSAMKKAHEKYKVTIGFVEEA